MFSFFNNFELQLKNSVFAKGCDLTAVEIGGDKALKAKVEDICIDAFTKIEYENYLRNFGLYILFYWFLIITSDGGGYKKKQTNETPLIS